MINHKTSENTTEKPIKKLTADDDRYVHNKVKRIFGKWIGRIGDRYFDSVKLYRCVKMFLALRKNGYPIYIRQYEEINNEVIKLNYLRK